MSESSSKRPPRPPATEPRRVAEPAPAAGKLAAPPPRPAVSPPEIPSVLDAAQPTPAPIVEKAAAPPAPPPRPTSFPPEIPGVGALAFFDAFAHGAEAVADEMAGLTRSGFSTMMETAEAMLGAKTLDEAIAIHAGFVRKSFDTMLSGSVRLGDIGARLAAEAMPRGYR